MGIYLSTESLTKTFYCVLDNNNNQFRLVNYLGNYNTIMIKEEGLIHNYCASIDVDLIDNRIPYKDKKLNRDRKEITEIGFIIDTGAQVTAINIDVLQELGIDIESGIDDFLITASGKQPVKRFHSAISIRFRQSNKEISIPTVYGIKMDNGYAGIIGGDVLKLGTLIYSHKTSQSASWNPTWTLELYP